MNPAGVMFTANASLNIPGAFAVSTANYLGLADGKNRFTAMPGIDDSSLSSAAVSKLGFLTSQNAPLSPVTFTGIPGGKQFSTVPNMNLIVVGGGLTVDGSTLSAPAGQLTLVSVAGAGEVPAVPSVLAATPLTWLPTLGTINVIDGSFVSVGSAKTGQAGHVEMDGAAITIDSSFIDASMIQIPSGEYLKRKQHPGP